MLFLRHVLLGVEVIVPTTLVEHQPKVLGLARAVVLAVELCCERSAEIGCTIALRMEIWPSSLKEATMFAAVFSRKWAATTAREDGSI